LERFYQYIQIPVQIGCKEDRVRLFSMVPHESTRGNGHKVKHVKLHPDIQ